MLLEGLIRRFIPTKGNQTPVAIRMTQQESLGVAMVEEELLEMTRAGRRFHGVFSTTGIAPVQAIPTTTASWCLYNNDVNRSYVIDSVEAFFLSGTAGIGGGFVGIVTNKLTAPAAATGAIVGSRSNGGLQSKAILATGTAITPSGNSQWGFMKNLTTLSVAPAAAGTYVACAEPRGGMIVPPGCAGGFALIAPAGTTPLYIVGCTWTEIELDLE